jgi:beta-glucosidase
MDTSSTISVKLQVTNTGSGAGAEVIQVYVNARTPSINRAVKELKGFKKVYLEAGEKIKVEIEVDKKYATSFWDEGRDSWIAEEGEYRVLVGNSSQGDFLEANFEVEKTWWWNGL